MPSIQMVCGCRIPYVDSDCGCGCMEDGSNCMNPPDLDARGYGYVTSSVIFDMEYVYLYEYGDEIQIDDYNWADYDIDYTDEWDVQEFEFRCPQCGSWSCLYEMSVVHEEDGIEVETPVEEVDNLADFFSSLVQKAA